MDHYKKMYYKLFNQITDTIYTLQAIQQTTEDFLINKETEKVSDVSPNLHIMKNKIKP